MVVDANSSAADAIGAAVEAAKRAQRAGAPTASTVDIPPPVSTVDSHASQSAVGRTL